MSKQISVADDAYELLKSLRRENESFTDVIRRVGAQARQKALLELAGSWKLSDEEAKRILDDIYQTRRSAKFRKVDL